MKIKKVIHLISLSFLFAFAFLNLLFNYSLFFIFGNICFVVVLITLDWKYVYLIIKNLNKIQIKIPKKLKLE